MHRVRFCVCKVDERLAVEQALQEGKPPRKFTAVPKQGPGSSFEPVRLKPSDFEKAKAAAPGWDVYCLEQEWRDWIGKKGVPENPGTAFVAFCRKKQERQGTP